MVGLFRPRCILGVGFACLGDGPSGRGRRPWTPGVSGRASGQTCRSWGRGTLGGALREGSPLALCCLCPSRVPCGVRSSSEVFLNPPRLVSFSLVHAVPLAWPHSRWSAVGTSPSLEACLLPACLSVKILSRVSGLGFRRPLHEAC